MAFPPDDIKRDELFLKVIEMPRPSDVVDFPRRDSEGKPVGRVRLQVLNSREYELARKKATFWFEEQFPKQSSRSVEAAKEVLGDRVAKEVLAMATLTVKPVPGSEEAGKIRYNRVFLDASDLDELTTDELTVLWMAQQAIQYRYGPYEGNLESEEQVTAWMKALVEGATAAPLAVLSWHQLIELCTLLAERAYTLSVCLGSPSKSLPTILDALPSNWGLGSFGHGKLPASLTKTGLSRSDLGLPEEELELVPVDIPKIIPDEPMDTATAARLAQEIYKGGD